MTDNYYDSYGRLHIIFAGDLRQLEPVAAEPIYCVDCPEFHHTVNCYIELTGLHRFKDKAFGELLSRFCNGQRTLEDICYLNQQCLVNESTVWSMNLRCYQKEFRWPHIIIEREML